MGTESAQGNKRERYERTEREQRNLEELENNINFPSALPSRHCSVQACTHIPFVREKKRPFLEEPEEKKNQSDQKLLTNSAQEPKRNRNPPNHIKPKPTNPSRWEKNGHHVAFSSTLRRSKNKK